MSPRRRKRLDPSLFQLPVERIRAGEYSDLHLALTPSALRAAKKNPRVVIQVTTKQDCRLSGIDEAIAILKLGVEDWNALVVHAMYEGDFVEGWDTVMTVEGDLAAFAHLETLILGALGHRTRVCTNVHDIAEAARPKTVVFFGARDEHFLLQPGDGFAAMIGGARQVATGAQSWLWGGRVLGTVPHSLIAAFGGDAVAATKPIAKQLPEDAQLLAFVDYDNDVVRTSIDLARALGDRLWAVRLDTSEHLVDKSVLSQMGTFPPTGVNPQLVWNVRNALDTEGFGDVQIVVSGGFDAAKVRAFEEEGTPVDAYGIGSAAYRGSFDFTADVVSVGGRPQARAGRSASPNDKLERVK